MARRRNPVIEWIITSACLTFGAITARLPIPVCRGLGRAVGLLAYSLVPRVRRVSLANLDLAYGDTLTRREKVRIAKRAAQNMAIVAAEFSHLPRLRGDFLRKHVRIVGFEHLDSDRGTVLTGTHQANWEWIVPAL
ncbi:MAG: hypothetical protein JXR94_02665, partial [Candidatus Hydrogenedentes bacterium]|nr:hypothetical protein [Candidatus Hydrogenedentota bacterium]